MLPPVGQIRQGRRPRAWPPCEAVEAGRGRGASMTVFALPGGGRHQPSRRPGPWWRSTSTCRRRATGDESKKAARAANLDRLGNVAARVLRLKGLGGLVVVRPGRPRPRRPGHDHGGRATGLRPSDNPGVALGAISRFGTLELTVPRRARDRCSTALLDETGGLSARALEPCAWSASVRAGRARADRRRRALWPVAAGRPWPRAFKALDAALADRIGRRFTLEVVADWPNDRLEVSAS
jgi:hypothetical protein